MARFLTGALPGECLLDAFLFPRLHIVGVFSDFLDNVFLLYLALKATQCAFNGFAFMNENLGHAVPPDFRYIIRML